MGKVRVVLLVIGGVAALTGCAASREARPAALTGDSVEPERRETKVVSVRDTRGHVRHRVVRAEE